MPGDKRKHQSITIHTKSKILCRHLYENAKIGDLGQEYNLVDSTISHMEKEQAQNLPRSCQGQSRLKE